MINLLLPTRAATIQQLGHPAAGVIGWFDSTENLSGVTVNRESALTFAAVWCATRIISETLATLPCMLYRRTTGDSRERAVDDPRFDLIHNEPHPEMTAVSFFETLTAHMVLQGNCYALMQTNGKYITEFEPRQPDNIRPEVNGSAIEYRQLDPPKTFKSEKMLHVAGLGGDGITGWSVVKYAAQSLGTAMAADNHAASSFGNGATPPGAIVVPGRMQKDAREQLRREWNEIHQGTKKAGRIAILHGGMDFKTYGMSNEDAQLLETRKYSPREVARWFRLPPHMLADLEDSSVRANIEQQAIEFVVYSLAIWLIRWQQTLNKKLLTREERKRLYFEFLLDALLRGDAASRYAAYATARQWGWMSVNDIRQKENMNAIDGGDVYLQPSNMVPAGTVPDSLTDDLQKNVAESYSEILASGRKLVDDLATQGATVNQAIADAQFATEKQLANIREARDEIRRDIAEVGKTVVRGWDAERQSLISAANELYRSALLCRVQYQNAEVVKAARRSLHGESFINWLDTFFTEEAKHLHRRIDPAIRAYVAATGVVAIGATDGVTRRIIAGRKADALVASDGDRNGFVDRIQQLADRWEFAAAEATIERVLA